MDPANLLLNAVMVLVPLILSLSVHEWAHAFSAKKLGDGTAESMGRLTLNPIAHIDPIGTLGLPLLLLITGSGLFFGWAKPVPVNPTQFNRNVPMRTGMTIVAAAGPMSNLVLAFLSMGVMAVAIHGGFGLPQPVEALLWTMVQINIVLAVFNMIPIHPLDGQKVLAGLLPYETAISYERFTMRYGYFVLIGIFVFAGRIIAVPVDLLFTGLLTVFGLA